MEEEQSFLVEEVGVMVEAGPLESLEPLMNDFVLDLVSVVGVVTVHQIHPQREEVVVVALLNSCHIRTILDFHCIGYGHLFVTEFQVLLEGVEAEVMYP